MGLFKNTDAVTKKYKISKDVLGEGNFAVVRKATRNNQDWLNTKGEKREPPTGVTADTVYAVKIIEKSKVEDMQDIEREIQIMTDVTHEFILNLYEIYDTPKKTYLITELASGGELFDKIVAMGNYTEQDAARVIGQLTNALDYLHKLNIVHRDLKPENILLATTESDSPIKLADFGLARIFSNDDVMKTACGTPGYVAPEVLKNKGYGSGKVDMWSVGVILYILLCGFPPFYEEELPALFDQIMKARYDFPSPWWDPISDNAKDLIKKLLTVEPLQRLGAEDTLTHVWLTTQAPETSLAGVGKEMKKYVAALRLKRATKKIMAINRLKNLAL